MTGMVMGIFLIFVFSGLFGKFVGLIVITAFELFKSTTKREVAGPLVAVESEPPIILGENSRNGLCPSCGRGSLFFLYTTVKGYPDMRYKVNPLYCACGWKGSSYQASVAAASVAKRIASRTDAENKAAP